MWDAAGNTKPGVFMAFVQKTVTYLAFYSAACFGVEALALNIEPAKAKADKAYQLEGKTVDKNTALMLSLIHI